MSDTATLDRPRNRGGRPATGQRENPVQVVLFDSEQRRLDALLRQRGKGKRGRATLLRELLLRELDAVGIEDPGPDQVNGAEVNAA